MEEASTALFQWFDNNLLKKNPGNSTCEKLLGVKLERKLNFDYHISDLCKKARGKLNALARIARFIGLFRRRILRKMYPYLELFWSVFSRIRTEYRVRMRKNKDQNNSE